ncbi:unnamed protein product, partial [Coregonus sp. 'balchen']
MAAQVATAPTSTGKKRSNVASSVSQDLKSAKSGVVGGAVLGVGNGTVVHAMNNVERNQHELNPNRARVFPVNNNSSQREKESGDSTSESFSTTNSSMSSGSMETGTLASHKVKNVSVGDPPQSHHHTPPQQQSFNQFIQHQQRQIHNNNQQSIHGGESGNHQHGGKENVVLGNQIERHQQQQMLNKSEEEDQPGKTEERMNSRYDHASLGPTNNNINPSQSGNSSVSEFNNSYYGKGRGGPCFDQHGGQQSPGSGIMHSVQQNNMDQVQQNSHEGYQNNPYNHYPNYRPGYGNSGYGMMSPSRQGNNMMGPASNTAAANHSRAAMAAASSSGGANIGGFHRFPGQSQQHPSGATPTLNQLLTSPSPMMRGYGSGYQDYTNPSVQQQQSSMGLTKDLSSQYGSATHSWGGQERNHPAMSPGNNGQGSGRSQVPPMDTMAMKRSQLYGMGNNPYSQQQQGGGGSYPGQPYGSPSPHRYPVGMPGRGQMGMSGMQYPQQQQPLDRLLGLALMLLQRRPGSGPHMGPGCRRDDITMLVSIAAINMLVSIAVITMLVSIAVITMLVSIAVITMLVSIAVITMLVSIAVITMLVPIAVITMLVPIAVITMLVPIAVITMLVPIAVITMLVPIAVITMLVPIAVITMLVSIAVITMLVSIAVITMLVPIAVITMLVSIAVITMLVSIAVITMLVPIAVITMLVSIAVITMLVSIAVITMLVSIAVITHHHAIDKSGGVGRGGVRQLERERGRGGEGERGRELWEVELSSQTSVSVPELVWKNRLDALRLKELTADGVLYSRYHSCCSMAAQYRQQQGGMGGYCQPQGQPPYFIPPQQQPTAPTQPPYMQPRPLPQQ